MVDGKDRGREWLWHWLVAVAVAEEAVGGG